MTSVDTMKCSKDNVPASSVFDLKCVVNFDSIIHPGHISCITISQSPKAIAITPAYECYHY